MWTGKPDPEGNEVPKAKRFRRDCLEMAVSNEVSSQRSARLAKNAQLAGARHVQDIAKLSTTPSKNINRDLLRKAVRNTKWPSVYEAQVPFHSEQTNKRFMGKMVFLLPHEVIHTLLKVNTVEDLKQTQGPAFFQGRPDIAECIDRVQRQHGLAAPSMALGLWIDAVPFNSDCSQSLECVTLSILGLRDWRVPVCCYPKAFEQKDATHEAILGILSWSFKCLLSDPIQQHGCLPGQDPATEPRRHDWNGMCVGRVAGGLEHAEALHVPSWSSYHICWLCQVKKTDVKNVSRDAAWRFLATD